MTPANPQMFREGLEARVLSTIAGDITAKQRLEDATEAQKIMCAQYDAELQAFKKVGEAKCGEAAQARRAAWWVYSRAKKARTNALSNLEYDLQHWNPEA